MTVCLACSGGRGIVRPQLRDSHPGMPQENREGGGEGGGRLVLLARKRAVQVRRQAAQARSQAARFGSPATPWWARGPASSSKFVAGRGRRQFLR